MPGKIFFENICHPQFLMVEIFIGKNITFSQHPHVYFSPGKKPSIGQKIKQLSTTPIEFPLVKDWMTSSQFLWSNPIAKQKGQLEALVICL